MAISKLISYLKKAFGKECVPKQAGVPLKFTTNTAENHPREVNEAPVEAGDVGGKEAGREKKRKKWWLFLPFSRRRATKKCNKTQAELHQNTAAGSTDQISIHDICIEEIHHLQEAPVSSSEVCTAETNLEQEVLQLSILKAPVRLSSEDDTDRPVSQLMSADGNFDRVVKSAVVITIESADNDADSPVHFTADEGIESAVIPTADHVTDSDPTAVPDKNHICWRYQLGKQLGEGGFGSVFEGIRKQDSLQVAVKLALKTSHTTHLSVPFHPTPLPLEIALAGMASRGPGSPSIIQLLDWQDFPDHYIMVMERPLPSMDMEEFLRLNGGVLGEHTAQYVMWQVIYAANLCCFRGVFHRDIKLENLLVNPNTLEVKLIDFGCGDLMKDSSYSGFSGTKAYCPPEYSERGRYHAKPATVYSLGVLLFTMLHGHFPSAYDLYFICNDWSKFIFSQECCHLMWACLQSRPEDRILLEHMQYHDWFMLDSPDQSHYQTA